MPVPSLLTVALACLTWLAIMFAIARWAQRNPPAFSKHWAWVYALSLAIHCTSWTFYGTVTQAARSGWWIPPTFIGAILLYVLGFGFMRKLIEIGRANHSSTIADFVATRLGKNVPLAALITLVAIIGMVPYIALQLKAVGSSFAMLTHAKASVAQGPWYLDIALYCALAMALFAIFFGAREANASAHNRGLVMAIAFESVFKLFAMLVVGLFVVLMLPEAPLASIPPVDRNLDGFAPQILLGAMAMFILPHQFHMAVVESRSMSQTKLSRWVLPLYLLLIALPVLPIAIAGQRWLGASGIPADLYVLALPMEQGSSWVALLAFLGGMSAATGMVVVSTLTLSLMVINHWITPALLRGVWLRAEGQDLSRRVIWARRVAIVLMMYLAWLFSRTVGSNSALADVGALSFSAMVPLIPAVLIAVYRPQTSPRAVAFGIIAGLLTWMWVNVGGRLLPNLEWHGIFNALTPSHWMGLGQWSLLAKGVVSSLVVSYFATLFAQPFLSQRPQRDTESAWQVRQLRELTARFLNEATVVDLFKGFGNNALVPMQLEAQVESELAKVLGSSSARLLLDAAQNEQSLRIEDVAQIVDESRVDLKFNQTVLEAALRNMTQGISVVDRDLRLVAWNPRYAELFGYPEELLQVGQPVADLARWAIEQTRPDVTNIDKAIERRLAYMRAGTTHLSERVFPDGSRIEIRGNPMPGGGFVATFTDVTEFRNNETALKEINESLESRVSERTQMLADAKHEAELANEAKTRFMTAVGHDLMQPLHAAQLFADGLDSYLQRQALHDHEPVKRLKDIRGALGSTTELLQGLLEMAKLKSGGLSANARPQPSRDVTDPLASEFAAIAADKGLTFSYSPSEEWIRADAMFVRRILQNFLSNAVRYSRRGEIALIVSVSEDHLRIEVRDQGEGIAVEEQGAIFEEFRRGENAAENGLGLGLSIASGLAELIDARIGMRSVVGEGSTFWVDIPTAVMDVARTANILSGNHHGVSEILLIDNDQPTREALGSMLSEWGHAVRVGDGNDDAQIREDAMRAQVWLFDYHLDNQATGVGLYEMLAAEMKAKPTLILTADISDSVRAQCQELGLILVSKPIRPLALKSVLSRLISASHAG